MKIWVGFSLNNEMLAGCGSTGKDWAGPGQILNCFHSSFFMTDKSGLS